MTDVPGVRPRVTYDRADAISAAWEAFRRRARKGRSWKGCENCPPARRDPNAELEVHHVISQRRLKRLARDKRLPRLRLLILLTDPRNTMLLCDRCHPGHESRMRRINSENVPQAAWEFARDLGLLDELLAEYPERRNT